jgi:hypothetical protein
VAQDQVNVRYMVNDVQQSVDWYTSHLGFEQISNAAPAFADVRRGALRLLLSGEKSSAGRPMPDGQRPAPGGWNREDRKSCWRTRPAMWSSCFSRR